jgi:putative sigma-54 modulation protein
MAWRRTVNIIVTGRHLDVTPAIRTHAEEKVGKLTKYYDLIQEIEVILDGSESKTKKAEIIINAEHNGLFVASTAGDDLYGCIDQTCHKLERQLTEHKDRYRNRKHMG